MTSPLARPGRAAAALFILLAAACTSAAPDTGREADERALAEAEARWEREPASEDACVWVGRRLGYVGRYEEAVEAFTRGLELHPDSAWLLRFRGHRWITLRRFDLAVADLERAYVLAAARPDEVEPDGHPNPAGVPIGTLRSNVDYHLGLALSLAGDFEGAARVYLDGLERARANDDRLVSHTHWTWIALTRLGREAEAEALLAPLGRELTILENGDYAALVAHYRGEITREELLAGLEPGTTEFATRAYGAAMKARFDGDEAAARALLETIVASGPMAAFGCIAAEAELAR